MNWQRVVLIAAAVLFLWYLGGHDVWAPDEPYFAEGAREMVKDGQWAVPHVNGVVTTDKPPLFFWLIALFSLPVGTVTPFTARLPSVLAALGTLYLVMRLGRRFYGPKTAVVAGAVLATTFMFWDKARWSQIDSLLCFLIWVALSAFEAYRAGDADGRRAGLLFWLAAALAVLAKGPVGFMLPLGVALVVLAVDRQMGKWRKFAPGLGPLLFVGVLGAWIAFAELAGPTEYSVWGALREHFIDRGIHGMHHKQPWWYFFERLPLSLLPWTGLIPGALLLAWRRRTPADRFVLVASLFVIVFFTVSTEKRELYALPSLPAFALMAASLVGLAAGWREPTGSTTRGVDRWAFLGQGIVGGLITLVAIALFMFGDRVDDVPGALIPLPAVVLLGAGIATVVFCWQRRIVKSVAASALGVSALYLITVTTIYPAMEPRKSARPFTLLVQETTADARAAGVPVLCYRLDNLPEHFAFHGNGFYTAETEEWQRLAQHLDRPERAFAVAHGGELEMLADDLQARTYLVAETRLARRDVLLLANYPHLGARPLVDREPESR
jgi:4-amino-4-deoxy-L-arabinose transferase-like glycosyltransferase